MELEWVDAGWSGGNSSELKNHEFYLEIDGLPAHCVTPYANYPKPSDKKNPTSDLPENYKEFLDNYTEKDIKSVIGEDIYGGYFPPDAGMNAVYSNENLLWASVIIQLGYPQDAAGICERRYGKQSDVNAVTLKMYHSTRNAEHAVLSGNTDFIEQYDEFALILYNEAKKILDANNANNPISIEIPNGIVFEYKESRDNNGSWITNEFSIETSEETYIVDVSEEIKVEVKIGDQWKGLNESELRSIPKDSVLRMLSENEPDQGVANVSVVRQKLVLDEGKCRFFVPDNTGKVAALQTLMTIDNKEISEDIGAELSYSVNRPDDKPEPTPTPDPTPNPSPEPTPDPSTNGGSSGGGGGSTTVPSGRYTTETGGPGETVTLVDGDVPLAALPPQSMDQISILDDEVPLAALPKTGDRNNANGAMFLFSSLLLAVYSLLLKKEKIRQ